MKTISCLSGGVDSTTALYWAKQENTHSVKHGVFFYYGSKHNDQEWAHVKKIAELNSVQLIRFDLDFVSQHFKSDLLKTGGAIPEGHYADPTMKKTVVPFRNGIMLSIAAGLAESLDLDGIVLGNHFGDHAIYPDCRKDFIDPMSEAIQHGTYRRIKLVSPFVEITKTDIVKLGIRLSVPYELTYSCYKGDEIHCGVCGTCVERREAFTQAGVPDPTTYDQGRC